MFRSRVGHFAMCVALLLTAAQYANAEGPSAADLYRNKQYFELRDLLAKRSAQGATNLFFRGVLANIFNKPRLSLDYLHRYLSLVRTKGDDRWVVDAYEITARNYLRTSEYKKAADAYNFIIQKLPQKITSDQKSDFENSYELWNALAEVPPQNVRVDGPTNLPGSWRSIPATLNGHPLSFGLDSGASLSIIIESLARDLGLKIFNKTVKVGSITGESVDVRPAMARELKVGRVTLHNVVFLVFKDKDLLEPSEGEVKGIFGFPVFAAFQELTVTRDGNLIIPFKPSNQSAHNLCIEGFKPLVAGFYQQKRLTFTLDTGARRSTMYPPFFKQFETQIKSSGRITDSEQINGAGGSKGVPAYRVANLPLRIAGHDATFPEIAILTDYTLSDSYHYYGNLGQDLIKQFPSMTINLHAMSFDLQ